MNRTTSRRRWLGQWGAGLAGSLVASAGASSAKASQTEEIGAEQTFFGDLHNHNVIGYAQGSLKRTFEIANSHLDFFAFTPHGYWPDIEHFEGSIEDKWLNGFAVVEERWPEVIELANEFDNPGRFVPMVGYESHSTLKGDYHIVFPTLDAPYRRHHKLKHFQQFAKEYGAILIPHHPANRLGHRGADFRYRDTEVSPLMEIYSEWGCAEHDRAPYPYIRHTEGGRWTKNTMQWLLAHGHRFGVIASTDDHLGYPGAYREGLAAVKAKELSREAIFQAVRQRRTYAVTGDRIELDTRVNGKPMGSEMDYAKRRLLTVAASGWDPVDRVEILRNNRVIHREFPTDRVPSEASWKKPVLIRFEYGWGPWPALAMARTFDWNINIEVKGGRLIDLQPCFTSGPLSESRRDQVLEKTEHGARIKSYTALKQQLEDVSQKSVVLKVLGGPETIITVAVNMPGGTTLEQTLGQLATSNEMLFTGEFPRESAMLHRLVFSDHYDTSFEVDDEASGEEDSWYYTRVVQTNGQLAWSSPIWVNRA